MTLKQHTDNILSEYQNRNDKDISILEIIEDYRLEKEDGDDPFDMDEFIPFMVDNKYLMQYLKDEIVIHTNNMLNKEYRDNYLQVLEDQLF